MKDDQKQQNFNFRTANEGKIRIDLESDASLLDGSDRLETIEIDF